MPFFARTIRAVTVALSVRSRAAGAASPTRPRHPRKAAIRALSVSLVLLVAPRPAQAAYLLVSNLSSNSVCAYDAITGATVNTHFAAPATDISRGLAFDGNNHLFIGSANS